jgi:hypothetical protein
VEHPFAAGNQILKLNVEDPAGSRNSRFRPSEAQMVLHEPWYVPRPDAISEDDGILLVKALDLDENKGIGSKSKWFHNDTNFRRSFYCRRRFNDGGLLLFYISF